MNRVKNMLGLAALGLMLAACSTRVSPPAPVAAIPPAAAPAPLHFAIDPILADSITTTQPAAPAAPAPDALPPGHPKLPADEGGQGPLPPGHPMMPADAGGGPALPPGHPMVGAAGATTLPSTQPSVTGVLTIHAVQKTEGAAPAGADPVVIEFYFKGQLLDQTKAQLTADGNLKAIGVPVKFGVQPLVKITHAGVVYAVAGEQMDMQHPDQALDVPIYESTDKAPDWSLMMRHVMVHPTAAGLEVMEMLAVQCPGDRAWIGVADAAGKRTTLSLPLPEGAKDIKIGGSLDSDAVTFDGGIMHSSQAIMPGEDRYELQYTIPASDNKATVSIVAPVKMGHVMVFVPEDGTTVTPAAPLQLMGSQQMDDKGPKTRYFMATQVPAGQKLTLTVSELKAAGAGAADNGAPSPDDAQANVPVVPSRTPRLLAVIGGASVLAIGAVVLLIKSPRTVAAKKK